MSTVIILGGAYIDEDTFGFIEDETDEHETILINRSWSAGATESPRHKDLTEKLVVVKNGRRVSVQNKEMWQDYINATIPRGITQFFFFDGRDG